MPGNLRLRLDDLLFRVIVPVVEKNLFVVLGGRGVVNDDSGIAIVKNALAGPASAVPQSLRSLTERENQPSNARLINSRSPNTPSSISFVGSQRGSRLTYELESARRRPINVSATIRPPTGPSFLVLIGLFPSRVFTVTVDSTVS